MNIMNLNMPSFDQSAIAIEKQKTQMANLKNTKEESKQLEAAQDFEAFFLSKMAETMFDGISTDGMFGGGHAEKVYRSLLVNEYGKSMAKAGSVGVADYVMRSMIGMQEMESQGYISAKKEV